jgi:hypothetical protein
MNAFSFLRYLGDAKRFAGRQEVARTQLVEGRTALCAFEVKCANGDRLVAFAALSNVECPCFFSKVLAHCRIGRLARSCACGVDWVYSLIRDCL